MLVRAFEEKDAEAASKILNAAFRSFLGDRLKGDYPHFRPDLLVKAAHRTDEFSTSEIFVAEAEGKLVGVVKVTAGQNGLGSFDYVGVDPAAHAQGIGARLMARAEEFWREHGQRKIATCVSAHNKKAVAYYLKHDFIPEGYRRDHFFVGVDEIILGRFLNVERR